MFNYFLIAAGIMANAYVLLIRGNLHLHAAYLAFAACLTSIGFVFLDKRNSRLVHLGEHLLRDIEKSILNLKSVEEHRRSAEAPGILLIDKIQPGPFYMKHGFIVEGIEFLAAASFGIAGLWAIIGQLTR